MTAAAPSLLPYVPRLLLHWQRQTPHALFRQIEGTLVFVDIAGFTAMSERLATKGKVGAEEVTAVLDASFSRLLAIAWDYGGGLLKFGGDALLLFFSDDGHAGRATRAAHLMRRELSHSGRIRTSAGPVRLSMSVGIHSGDFHFFLAGDSHRELIITGPAVTHTVEMESAATGGEIMVSGATGSLLGQGCLGEKRGAGALLRKPPGQPPPARIDSELADPPPDVAPFVPEALRRRLSADVIASEHRQVAVAFVNFVGIDGLIIGEGPAEAQSRLDQLVRATQRASHDCEICFLGTDVAADGGKIILAAGAPYSAGDDDGRILKASREIADGDYGLDIRIGVNRGHVFAGEVGATFRRTYTVMGDAVNLAARVMARAESGQVLATPDVLEHSHLLFETSALEAFRVKGKAHPVTAYAVGRPTGFRERYAGGALPPLVGRKREVQQMVAAAETARHGEGRYLLLIGDAGLGKSRLAAVLKERFPDMRHLSVACEQYEISTAYFPFRGLLRSLVGSASEEDAETAGRRLEETVSRVAPDLRPWLPLIAMTMDASVAPTPEAAELDPAFRGVRAHNAVASLLSELLPTPTILLVEDAHWMDQPSRELLAGLARGLATRPWLMCVTSRPAEQEIAAPAGTPGLTVRLRPLDEKSSGQLVQATSQGLLPGAIATIAGRAGGNPLFLRELVAAAHSQADIEVLPDSVEALITSRLDRLAAPDLLLLRCASVAGPTLSLDLLPQLLPAPISEAIGEQTWSRLGEFIDVQRSELRFKHALFRDVAYEGLPFHERRRLHGCIGTALEERLGAAAEDQAELLSLHFYRAQENERGWSYSLAAGRGAQEKFANVEAAEFYRRAMEMGRRVAKISPAELARVSEALGDVCELAGLFDEAASAYRQARRLVPDIEELQPGLLLKEGVIRERRGHYSQALGFYRRGLNRLLRRREADVASQRVRLRAAYAGVRLRQGRAADCVRWCEEVLKEAEAIGDRANMAHAYYLMDHAYTFLRDGRPQTSFALLALDIYEELGDLVRQANVLNNLGIEAYFAGRWSEALRYYERSREARDRSGDVIGTATATNNIAEILSDQGRLDEAEPLFREALQVWKAAGYPIGVALATSNLGRLAARRGNYREAARLLDQSFEGFREIRAKGFEVETQARLAETMVLDGRCEEAARLAEEALSRAGDAAGTAIVRASLHRVLGCALFLGGSDVAAAEHELNKSRKLAQSAGVEYELALTLEALAELSQAMGRSGSVERQESEKILQRLGVRKGGGAAVSRS